MVEYLKNYKKLLELQKNNEKQIKEKKLLITDNYQKWLEEKNKTEYLDTELGKLNKECTDIIERKEKNILDIIAIALTILSIVGVIILSINHPIFVFLGPVIALFLSSSIYMLNFIIIKHTSILKKQFQKDENIKNLYELIKIKEKELTNTKELVEKYSQTIIKCRSELKKLVEKQDYINESINELMRNYATPIFEKQLKNIKKKEQKTRTKKKK